MVVGTTSHAGKSLLTAAICRLLVRAGHRVAPFKGQNMALNAYVTADGGEIGHAQAVQAWAARVEPQVRMNPILLKPQGDMTSQVILMGQPVGQVGAAAYYEQYFDRGWQAITSCLDQLRLDYDYIVCEGAGSPAEINLKHRDLTNMRVASYLNASTVLVADIERGGVFAHIVGTLELLTPAERQLIKGFVINKFRGQQSLLQSGLDWLEDRTGIPVLGVLPYFQPQLPAEDSVDLFDRQITKPHAELQIGVLRLPRMANFTDFDPLMAEPTVQLTYLDRPQPPQKFDALIIPGSKTTIADCQWLHSSGLATMIREHVAGGGALMGICGGWQMLGTTISDPAGLEGWAGEVAGLGLLPVRTVIDQQKVLRQRRVDSQYFLTHSPVYGYEIHQGLTTWVGDSAAQPLFSDDDLGCVVGDRIWGTYLHGIFDHGEWRRAWLNQIRQQQNLAPLPTRVMDYAGQRDLALDAVADVVDAHLNWQVLMGAG
jgi:adenosylcobyric acid synthase